LLISSILTQCVPAVKQEASTRDLFQLMLQSPQSILDKLGSETKYRALLRRIAANPPFTRVSPQLRKAKFLIAYTYKAKEGATDNAEVGTYILAAAEDIFIVDNSFFARMFPVNRAPPESDLEDFYVLLGSAYISKSVDRRFEVVGAASNDTALTKALKERIFERSPLLISPSITSRPLVSNASVIVDKRNLDVYEAPSLMAVYSLRGIVRRAKTTCFSRQVGMMKTTNAIYVVKGFDWFDVGYAIGDLILQRCQLEDAFFISSLLEAPLEQLRNRGFPVDRILQPIPVVKPPEPPKPPAIKPAPEVAVAKVAASQNVPSAAKPSAMDSNNRVPPAGPTMAAIPPHMNGTTPKRPPSPPRSAAVANASSPETNSSAENQAQAHKEGFERILHQMFPDADEDIIRAALGDNPTLDNVRALAEGMASGSYPRKELSETDSETVATSASIREHNDDEEDHYSDSKKPRGGGLRKKLGRAFGGFRGSNSISPPNVTGSSLASGTFGNPPGSQSIAGPATSGSQHRHEKSKSVSPAADAQSQHNLERLLESTVGRSSKVSKGGFDSPDSTITSIPEGLDRGDTCEVLPGQSLKPFPGFNGTGKSRNGIQLFSASSSPASEEFMASNTDALEKFAVVIENLCGIFGLKLSSVAIFHDPSGGTIAFNRGGALHYNVRFFHALHYLAKKHNSSDCYSYWFVTTAHELAHHMVSAHNKEHGFYTESYVSHYLPKLVSFLSSR
jgi:hypothetical protein